MGLKTILLHRLSKTAITKREIFTTRLIKYLWVELLLNPGLVKGSRRGRGVTKELRLHLERAAKWYLAYRSYLLSLGLKNVYLEDLIAKGIVKPSKGLDRREYNQHIREFLKGLQILWKREEGNLS